MNNDKLNSVVSLAAVQSAYSAVSAVQDLPAEEQVAGVALLFTLLVNELGLNPVQLVDASNRRVKDADNYYTSEIRGLRGYIQGELR